MRDEVQSVGGCGKDGRSTYLVKTTHFQPTPIMQIIKERFEIVKWREISLQNHKADTNFICCFVLVC